MYIQPIPFRILLSWLFSFTLVGVIDMLITYTVRGYTPSLLWEYPAHILTLFASGKLWPGWQALVGLATQIYLEPFSIFGRFPDAHDLFAGGGPLSWYQVIVIAAFLNSCVCIALAIAFLRRLFISGNHYAYSRSILEKPAWLVPYFMTYAIITLLTFPVYFSGYARQANENDLIFTYAIMWIIGGILGLFGTIWGYRYSRSARNDVHRIFASSNLPDDNPIAQRTIALAKRIGIPAPAVATFDVMNALAVGNNARSAAIVLGTPLIELLDDRELNAVIGHELGHIVTADMQRMQIAAGFESLFDTIGKTSLQATKNFGGQIRNVEYRMGWLLSLITLGALRWTVMLLARLGTLAFSRAREYRADAVGAALTSPAAMISALEKLHGISTPLSDAENAYGYMMFRAGESSLFSTHPSVERRISALRRGKYRLYFPSAGEEADTDPYGEAAYFSQSSSLAKDLGFRLATLAAVAFKGGKAATSRVSGILRANPPVWLWIGLGTLILAIGFASLNAIDLVQRQQAEQRRLEQVRNDLEPKQLALSGRESQLVQLQKSLDEKQASLAAQDERSKRALGEIERRESDLRNREAAFTNLLENTEPETRRLMQLQESVRAEKAEAERASADAKREREGLEKARVTTELAINNMVKERRRLEADKAAAGPEVAELRSLRDEIERKQAELETTKAETDSAYERLSTYEANITSRLQELAAREKAINDEWQAAVNETPGNIFGAMAMDDSGTWWGAWNYNAIKTAREAVSRRCSNESLSGGCRVAEIRNGCISMARGDRGGWATGTGATRNEAGLSAVKACNSVTTGCRTTKSDTICAGVE
jgi:Zn-dependent protease with chaperone function/peptidoglycan hydrolase CwlO-like protein